jgi:hypothetical protein
LPLIMVLCADKQAGNKRFVCRFYAALLQSACSSSSTVIARAAADGTR